MSDWSVSKRITVLSAVLVAAMLLAAASGIGAALRLANVFGSYQDTTTDTIVIVRTQEDALEARAYEVLNRVRRDSETAALADSNLAEIFELEDELERLLSEDPVGRAAVAGIIGEIGEYRRMFAEALAAQAVIDETAEAATNHGSDLARHLGTVMDEASADLATLTAAAEAKEQGLLAILTYQKSLLAQRDDGFEEMTEYLEAARSQLDAMSPGLVGTARTAANEALSDLSAFAEDAEAARAAIISQTARRAEMDALSADVLARLNSVLDVEVDRQTELAARGESVLITVIAVLAAICLAAVSGGIFFALATARRIRTAIARSVSEMQELASGNLEATITGADKDHELGQMAKALVVFRDNANAARALEAQQAEQERAARQREEELARQRAEAEEESRRQAADTRARMVAELRDGLGAVVDGAASGDFSRRITARFAEEEFNRMANGVNLLMSNVETGVKEVARVMSKVAAGDLTERMNGSYAGLFAELQSSVNETLATLTRVVDDIAAGCDAVTKQASQMTEQSAELARRAEQQAASLEETSAAMEEISATARSSAEGAAHANDFATKATGRVDEAGRVVASAVGAMGDIRAASTRIGEIVSVIEGIAFQTNLLALNASVEAARAGSAGKGFAVVATEVRALAQRSSTASQDIKALIDESAAQVNRGVSLVEETGTTLKEIVEGVRHMAGSLGELVTAGREQAVGVQEVTTAIAQLDVITQKNATLADQSRELAGDLKSRAEAMEGLVATFRTGEGRLPDRIASRGSDDFRFEDDWQAA
jgi:methyl-accepting chemotaxis protein